ncbi:MAG: hypothetical protein K1X67_08065 [Fimbriimonadaceae bacterium]|nr:hypothetical protein [Fimbriimonadaceae bacterium]
MSILKPTNLIFMGLRDGRIALLRGVGTSKMDRRFPISVDTYVPDDELLAKLQTMPTPCELTVVLDNEGTETPVHLISAERIRTPWTILEFNESNRVVTAWRMSSAVGKKKQVGFWVPDPAMFEALAVLGVDALISIESKNSQDGAPAGQTLIGFKRADPDPAS